MLGMREEETGYFCCADNMIPKTEKEGFSLAIAIITRCLPAPSNAHETDSHCMRTKDENNANSDEK